MPSLCAVRITSSHWAASALPLIRRLRVCVAKISAPPPGIESSPASLSSTSTCSTLLRYSRWKKKTSTAVNAFTWTSGRACLIAFSMSVK